MQELLTDIIESLESLKEEKRIEFMKTACPTQSRVIGVTVPNMKKVLKEVVLQTKKFTKQEKVTLAKQLIQTEIFECHHMAYEYLGKDKKNKKLLTEADLDDISINLDNWVFVDTLGVLLTGFLWREQIIPFEKIEGYLLHEDFWKRRLGVVATIPFNQKAHGGTGNATETLKACKYVVDDHHDMLVKALSWALRVLAKVEAEPVEDFLAEYEDRLHKKVLREVRNTLLKGTKN